MTQSNVVDRLVDQLEAAGVRLSVDDRTEHLICRGRLAHITPSQDALIRQHVLEVKAAVRARAANWQVMADRKISSAMDALRSNRRHAMAGIEWEQRLAVLSVACCLQSTLMLEEALAELYPPGARQTP
jgi:hypothetical protein